MTDRWTAEQVLALTGDAASRKAAAKVGGGTGWSGTGAAGPVIWGLCAGSGKEPYQVAADVSAPAYLCSCPSRKVPCKHVLGLLLAWAAGEVPDAASPADYAASWTEKRAARAAGAAARRGAGPKDEQAAARRAGQRASRVGAGLAELETWLRDQVRAGLPAATAPGRGGPGAGPYGHARQITARMVDAQAPGVAAALRQAQAITAASGEGWPGRLLGAYARLHLLVRAHGQLDTLPGGLAATVRAHVGYPMTRAEVLARPAVRDTWLVLAVRDEPDAEIPARRIWVRGQGTGRVALVLVFDPRGDFGSHAESVLVPGLALTADLHYYPGQPELRAQLGTRHDEEPWPWPAPLPWPPGGIDSLLGDWGAALAADPWLARWPVLVSGTPVPADTGWQLAGPSGTALPLLTGGIDEWLLLAISGGAPVTVAGEWTDAGLTPLTTWHDTTAVPL